MKINEISKELYEVELDEEFPIYIKTDEQYIRMTQPTRIGGKFKEEDYFGKGFPQEIVIQKKYFKELLNILGKLLIVENLK